MKQIRLFTGQEQPFLSDKALTDLGIDRILTAVFGSAEKPQLRRFLKQGAPTEEIALRQELFQHIYQQAEEQAFLKRVAQYAHELHKLRTLYQVQDTTTWLFWFRYVQTYCLAIDDLASWACKKSHVDHAALILSLHGMFTQEAANHSFTHLRTLLETLSAALSRYTSTAMYLQVSHTEYTEAAVFPITTDMPLSQSICDTIQQVFGEEVSEAAPHSSLHDADQYLSLLFKHEDGLAPLLADLISVAEQYSYIAFDDLADDIGVVWDIQKLLAFFETHRIPLCYATITNERTFSIIGGTDVSLLDRISKIVPNDFCESAPITLLHGANSGGKTAFMRMIGVCVATAMLGLPSPACKITCPAITAVYTIFTQTETLSKGRLFAEKDMLNQALNAADPQTLLLINEVFSSTNEQDAAKLSSTVLHSIFFKHSFCLWNTHQTLLSIAREIPCVSYAPLVAEDGTRTYIISKQANAASKALDIAVRYGLEKTHILKLWQENGMIIEIQEGDVLYAIDPML